MKEENHPLAETKGLPSPRPLGGQSSSVPPKCLKAVWFPGKSHMTHPSLEEHEPHQFRRVTPSSRRARSGKCREAWPSRPFTISARWTAHRSPFANASAKRGLASITAFNRAVICSPSILNATDPVARDSNLDGYYRKHYPFTR